MSKYLTIKDARPNLSKLIKTVGKTTDSYIIGVRNEPKAVLVDIDTAKKYLPTSHTNQVKEKEETGGERFVRIMEKWFEDHPVDETKPKENISGNVDKIVYGL